MKKVEVVWAWRIDERTTMAKMNGFIPTEVEINREETRGKICDGGQKPTER